MGINYLRIVRVNLLEMIDNQHEKKKEKEKKVLIFKYNKFK
tara:strand:+ start:9046 stop:9168 length:123 start_codon:yes stop_codon:yes gene_type:complete